MKKLFTLLCLVAFTMLLSSRCSDDDAEPTPAEPDPIDSPVPEATHHVGPSHPIKQLQDIVDQLEPGDVVEVDGDFEYTGGVMFSNSGTAQSPIIIRGKSINGKRPVIKQGPQNRIVVIDGANMVFEGFEVIGQPDETTRAGIGVYANNVTIRNCVIHDCRNGILGYGSLTGNVLVEYCEIYHCGGEPKTGFDFAHQIYMANDEVAHPNAVFRLQFSYIHDAKGGNNVKTRSGRNEIYYNWIEGPRYHALELIGPDLSDNDAMTEDTKREDSDVVGNVLIAPSNGSAMRLGGDGTGQTKGRYRIVNNTFILSTNSDGLRGNDAIETVELYNNIFYKAIATGADVFSEADVEWVTNRQVKGSNNFLQSGLNKIPAGLLNSQTGASPGFASEAQFNYTLSQTSPLLNHGTMNPETFSSAAFPSPLFPPAYFPPVREHIAPNEAIARPSVQTSIDIGAF